MNDFAQALSDPQVVARDMVVSMTLQSGEVIRMPGVPMKFSQSNGGSFAAPPGIGRDSRRILSDMLGYDEDRIDALQQSGTLGAA